MGVWKRAAVAALVAILALGGGRIVAFADVQAGKADNVQEGDNSGSASQDGTGSSGDAVTGQVVGGVVSGDAHVDATNRSVDTRAKSGDADGSNSASGFVGLNVQPATQCPTPQFVDTADCPAQADAGFVGQEADILGGAVAFNIQEGDNSQSIDQSANAASGDSLAGGQVIGFIGSGITDIVASNDSVDAKSKSGDADAINTINDAEANNLVVEQSCCSLTTDITGGTIDAAIVQEGDNDQSIDQTANATSGDALAGSQVIGAVNTAGGRTSIDATNRSRDADAKSGNADAANSIDIAAVGNAALNVTTDCCAFADINATSIDAVIVQEGDNDQSIDQAADASSGDALAGSQVTGSVDSGTSDIVVSNDSVDAKAKSGEADASNTITDAEADNLVTFAACETCPLPQDITAGTLSAVILQEGDNSQAIDQTADASSGDALAGSQVVGNVSGAGGDVSIDATNRSRDAKAKTGDADADNNIDLAAVGNAALDVPLTALPADINGGRVHGIDIQEGDNDQTIDQTADASSGDALGGSQVVGSVGGRSDIVVSNDGTHTDVTSGDASFENNIGTSEVGQQVEFTGLPCCPTPTASHKAVDTAILLVVLVALMYGHRRRGSLAAARDANEEHLV